jgi:hypothetical protein
MPAVTVSDPTPDQIMDRAADLLDEKGWCRGRHYDERTGAMCMEGALRQTACSPTRSPAWVSTLNRVSNFIENHLEMFITTWNDQHCQDRNEATELLRTEAKRYREERDSG